MNAHSLIRNKFNIACPACKTGRVTLKFDNVYCMDCGASFPIKNGVIDLLHGSTLEKSPAQSFMDREWLIKIYESRLWRKNPIFYFLMGITFKGELDLILQVLNLERDETLLDLACGPGIYTRPFAKKLSNGAVVGLDLSMPILDYAVKKAQSEGIKNCVFVHGDALQLPFPDNQFDAVNCCGALHLFPYPEVIQGITRILKPGGCFTVAAAKMPDMGPMVRKIRDWYQRNAGVKGFSFHELVELLEKGGLTRVECHHKKHWWLIMSGMKPQ
ncbi:MAG: class I SAM-dependent methyltransferase [Candidatus Methanofastidiosia archaeon]|jgi:SAM-dependent methyltransferase